MSKNARLLAGALLALSFSAVAAGAVAGSVASGPPLTAPKILDISESNGEIDTARMKTADVSAVIVRASHGATPDAQAVAYVTQLRAASIAVPAVYHDYDPALPWAVQYDALAGVMDAVGIERAAVRLSGPMTAAALTGARAMLDELVEDFPLPFPYRHLIFTDADAWQSLGSPAWGAQYELWLMEETAAPVPDVPAPWKSWKLWQYTATAGGAANGVESTYVGISRFNGSSLQFEGWSMLTRVRGGGGSRLAADKTEPLTGGKE